MDDIPSSKKEEGYYAYFSRVEGSYTYKDRCKILFPFL
jgi:hypothetical protein